MEWCLYMSFFYYYWSFKKRKRIWRKLEFLNCEWLWNLHGLPDKGRENSNNGPYLFGTSRRICLRLMSRPRQHLVYCEYSHFAQKVVHHCAPPVLSEHTKTMHKPTSTPHIHKQAPTHSNSLFTVIYILGKFKKAVAWFFHQMVSSYSLAGKNEFNIHKATWVEGNLPATAAFEEE